MTHIENNNSDLEDRNHPDQNVHQAALRALRAGDFDFALKAIQKGQASIPDMVEDLKIYQAEILMQNEELKQNQLITENAMRRFVSLFDSLPLPALVIDESGVILECNNVAMRMFGLSNKKWHSYFLPQLIAKEEHNRFRKLLLEAKNIGTARETIIQMLSLDGGRFIVDLHVVLLPPDFQETQNLVVTIVDQTENIAQRNELEANHHNLVELQTAMHLAEAKSRFLANMSHEIRTPLNAVLGFAELGLKYANNTEKTQNAFSKILMSGKHLLSLVNDILDLAKLEEGKITLEWRPIDLRQLLSECIETCRNDSNKKGLAIELVIDDNLPSVALGDRLRLNQIIMNLLSNAIKFTESGTVQLRAYFQSSRLKFEISDTGIGILPEHFASLFTPFQQADGSSTRKYGGSGLGLVISKNLASLMNATISVDSTHGKGSCFTLSLPYHPAQPSANISPPVSKSHVDLRGIRVLAVDDADINLLLLEENLTEAGMLVTTAQNGLEAVNIVESQGRNAFDIILMDIQMPEMDGLTATKRILELDPDVPVIGLTAHAFPEDRAKCLSVGMIDHITKPVEHAKLQESLKKYLSMHQKNSL